MIAESTDSSKRTPTEVDLADPASDRWRANEAVDAIVGLEELYPGDPGQLSGCSLRVMGKGEYASLQGEIGHHSLGFLDEAELAEFVSAFRTESDVRVSLCEIYPSVEPRRSSGFSLLFVAGNDPEIRLYSGFTHCLGRLSGPKLQALMSFLNYRVFAAVEG